MLIKRTKARLKLNQILRGKKPTFASLAVCCSASMMQKNRLIITGKNGNYSEWKITTAG